jgi:branched-chain amino acid transport system substrate-binding protein
MARKVLRWRMPVMILCILVAATFGLAGCGKKTVDSSKSVYKIGAVLSLSGPAAPLGQPEQRALQMMEEQLNAGEGVNGHKVQFIIIDDQSDPAKAKEAITKLINQEGVAAVIGSSSTGATLAMAPVAESSKVTQVCCAAGTKITDPVQKYVFRTPPTDSMAIDRVLLYLTAQKISKIAILHDQNAFGTGGADELSAKAPKSGVTVVARESYGSTDTDMTAQLTKIKGTPAQAVVVWGTNPGPASIAKNMQQLGMTIPFIGSHGIANKKFIELAGAAANGVAFPAGRMLIPSSIPEGSEWRNVVDKFITDYKTKFNLDADTFAGHGWDAGLIFTEAMKTAGSDKTLIQSTVQATKGLTGIGGVFTYSPTNHNGLKVSDLIMVKIENGNWVEVKATSKAIKA